MGFDQTHELILPGDPSFPTNSACSGGEPRGSHTSRDGDGCLGALGGGDDDDGDGDGGEVEITTQAHSLSLNDADGEKKGKKPKKRKTKKKSKPNGPPKQSMPPRVPLSDIFPSDSYPKGEVQSYEPGDQTTVRKSAGELRSDTRRHWEDEGFLQNYRKAAEVHRQARQWAQETAQPGQTVQEIVTGIEDSVRALLGNAGLEPGDSKKSGMGFPTGLCLNHQVAHYTPNAGQKEVVLKHEDVITIDFGVHINGWIVDSAFTMAFDPTYDNLLAAVKDATNAGIRVNASSYFGMMGLMS